MSKNVLEWKNLFYEKLNIVNGSEVGFTRKIDGFSGKAVSGQLTAIMGSNEFDKTSICEVLIGNIEVSSRTSGRIYFNGKQRKIDDWLKKISFFQQDDVYLTNLTIYENMSYSLKLLYPNVQEDALKNMIFKILKDAKISHKKNSIIDSLSPGEKRRAAIAFMLIGDPKILILDEPIKGLDSAFAKVIVRDLKGIAQKRDIIVIITVDRCEDKLFNLFDKLFYITKKGVFYEGSVGSIDKFLESNKIVSMARISTPKLLTELFSENPFPYEIKDLQPLAKEIIRKNREKYDEVRRNLEFSVGNNRSIYFKDINFDHISILMSRRSHFFLLPSYLSISDGCHLFFVQLFFFVHLILCYFYFPPFKRNAPQDLKAPIFIPFSDFENYFFILLRFVTMYSLLIIFLLTLKFSSHLKVCKREIFMKKYSIGSYFLAMIFSDLYFFLTRCFLLASLFIFCFYNPNLIVQLFLMSIAYFVVAYFSCLPWVLYFNSLSKISILVFIQNLFLLLSPTFLKSLRIKLMKLSGGFKFVFYLFNFYPLFLFDMLTKYLYFRFIIGRYNDHFDEKIEGDEFVLVDELLKSYDFLGHNFSPIYIGIWVILILIFFIYLSFSYAKKRVSCNIRLMLDKA